jgi:hypothetical protein
LIASFKDYTESRNFYRDFGFSETVLSWGLSYFIITDNLGFYLQKAYVKDWILNSMLFLEVGNVGGFLTTVYTKKLTKKYPKVKISKIVENDWGREFFVHDPSGTLW